MRLPRLIALSLAFVMATAPAAQAEPMPPQLPSAEEMARLTAQVQGSLNKVRAAQADLDAVVRTFEEATDRLTVLAGQVNVATIKQAALDAELRAAQAGVDKRAASVYRSERIGIVNALLDAQTFREFTSAFTLIKAITRRDGESLGRVRDLRADAIKGRADLEQQKQQQQVLIEQLRSQQKQVNRSLKALAQEYEVVRVELDKRKSGFAFPVKAPYSYIDTWGAPRMEGTRYYHRHEGTDIFALSGTPVLAVVDGVIENAGTATLGGIKLWLRSPGDNWTYYYAHLSGFAPGITTGTRVKKGDAVGFVGNTGNARGTPPHLHFETHVPAGPATNPYPILKRVDPLKS